MVIGCASRERVRSLPVRGAWVEMCDVQIVSVDGRRRSPCGERGLKYSPCLDGERLASRSPCGERGLKLTASCGCIEYRCRSPCGERGLKWLTAYIDYSIKLVAPRAGSVG